MKRIFAFLAVLMAFGLFGTLARAADAVIGLSAGFDFRVDLTDADDRDRNDFESNAARVFTLTTQSWSSGARAPRTWASKQVSWPRFGCWTVMDPATMCFFPAQMGRQRSGQRSST